MRKSFNPNINDKKIDILNKFNISNKNIIINLKKEYNILSNSNSSKGSDLKNKKSKDILGNEISALSNFKFPQKEKNSRNSFTKNKIYESACHKIKRKSSPTILKNSSNINNKPLTHINNNNINFTSVNLESKECITTLRPVKKKKSKFLDVKKADNEFYSNNISKTPKNYKSNNIYSINYGKELFLPRKSKQKELSHKKVNANFNSYDYFDKNDKKVIKIKENIRNEIGSKELRKKIHLMKQAIIQFHDSKELQKLIYGDMQIPGVEKV